MKKVLLAFSATAIVASATFAQAVPNGGFENWATDTTLLPTLSPYIVADTFTSNEPADWTTSNVITGSPLNFGAKTFVTESNDVQEGTSAIQLTVDTVGVAALGGGTYLTIPGFAVSGKFPIDFSAFTSTSIDLTSLPGA